tara:strand:- start:3197 stop:4117 length:921 start_codon:yes stop_codon:yes gene_type:complete
MKIKLLITGIGGFIGSKIGEKAIEKGYKVIGVDDLSNGNKVNIPSEAHFIKLDLSKKENIAKLPPDIDFILHLAGQSSGDISFDDPILDLEKNTHSTLNLISYGIENKVKKILYASSMSVYGSVQDKPISEEYKTTPLSCYGVGKKTSENYLSIYKHQLPFLNYRMFNVYGPGQNMSNLRQGMVSIFLSQAVSLNSITVRGSLKRFRDFIYIDDVVECWLRGIELENLRNLTINIGTGKRTEVRFLVDEICSHFKNIDINVKESTQGDQFGIYSDNKLMKDLFQIKKTTSLQAGIKKFVTWAKNNK